MIAVWVAQSIDSVSDLAFSYASSADLLSDFTGDAFSDADRATALAEWERAKVQAKVVSRKRARSLVAGPIGTAEASSSSAPVAMPRPSVAQGRRVKEVSAQAGHSEAVCFAPAESLPADEPAPLLAPGVLDLTDPVVHTIYEVYVDMAELGERWIPCEAGQESLHRELFVRTLKDASLPRLKAAISALKRWRSWLATKQREGGAGGQAEQTSPFAPSALMLGGFLVEVASGGPTAASGVWAHLEWWRTAVGMPLPTTAPLVVSFKWVKPGHFTRSTWELPVWAFLNLAKLAVAERGAVSMLAALVLLLAMSCIRWEHSRRSRVVAFDGAYIYGHCSMGKSRKGGSRPGFAWRAPRFLAPGQDTLGGLQNFFKDLYERCPGCSFLVPKVDLKEKRLQPQCAWRQTSMPSGRFLELMRGILILIGVPAAVSETSSFKTLRRFLPSLGEVLGMDPEEKQSLGNWAEVPKGLEQSKVRAVHPTARIYAGDKEASAAANKHKAVIAIHIAAERLKRREPQRVPASTELWAADSIMWSTIRAARPCMETAGRLAARGPPWSTSEPFTALPGAEAWMARVGAAPPRGSGPAQELHERWSSSDEEPAEPAEEAQEAEASKEGSASDVSEPEEVFVDDTLSCPPIFKLTLTSPAHLQSSLQEGKPVAFCRESPFRGKASLVDVDTAVAGGWCHNCLTRMPSPLSAFVQGLKGGGGLG